MAAAVGEMHLHHGCLEQQRLCQNGGGETRTLSTGLFLHEQRENDTKNDLK
jgi:hypothetical protein